MATYSNTTKLPSVMVTNTGRWTSNDLPWSAPAEAVSFQQKMKAYFEEFPQQDPAQTPACEEEPEGSECTGCGEAGSIVCGNRHVHPDTHMYTKDVGECAQPAAEPQEVIEDVISIATRPSVLNRRANRLARAPSLY